VSDPRRVPVTSPRTQAPRVTRHWPVARDIDEQTELGTVYVRSLMRAQLRLALVTSLIVVPVVVGLPLLFTLAPGLSRLRILGVPLPWLVLALCIHPVWIVTAAWHVRQAERMERDFTDVVERS
jgi:hypothetical protein